MVIIFTNTDHVIVPGQGGVHLNGETPSNIVQQYQFFTNGEGLYGTLHSPLCSPVGYNYKLCLVDIKSEHVRCHP